MELALAFAIAPLFAILWHESAHALFALAVTSEEVTLQAGFGPAVGVKIGRLRLKVAPMLLGGFCVFDGTVRRGDRALVAAAGPVSSAFLAALAWNLSRQVNGDDRLLTYLLADIALVSASMTIITALPIRYPGLTHSGESDGLTVLRALFPTSSMVLPTVRAERRPERPLRWPFIAVLVVTTPVAFMASIWTGLTMVVLFGLTYRDERR